MPLQSLKLAAPLSEKLRKRTRGLLTNGYLNHADKPGSWEIGFCMHIQLVPKKKFERVYFGNPEGLRVFIQSGMDVIAAVDFLFAGKRLRLSCIHQGQGLKSLLDTLNQLEKKYALTRTTYHAELIYFLLSPGPYVLVKSKKKKQFYYLKSRRAAPISAEGLKKQINHILMERAK